jgi:anti-anti-sigma regulatory factor
MSLAHPVGDRWIVIDLTRCIFMDSTGVGALMRVRSAVGKVMLLVPIENRAIERPFELINMRTRITMLDSRESAIAFAVQHDVASKSKSA